MLKVSANLVQTGLYLHVSELYLKLDYYLLHSFEPQVFSSDDGIVKISELC